MCIQTRRGTHYLYSCNRLACQIDHRHHYLPQFPRELGALPGSGRRALPLLRFCAHRSARAHRSSSEIKPRRRESPVSPHRWLLLPEESNGRQGSHGVGGARSGTKEGNERLDKICKSCRACLLVSLRAASSSRIVGDITKYSSSLVSASGSAPVLVCSTVSTRCRSNPASIRNCMAPHDGTRCVCICGLDRRSLRYFSS
mmetsp:Transcript_25496/g.47516  ORF Transcript_25496/g.47516 Transcript_25496/m.47516 type:complete len:200 (-) Transcript_25496:126-725(-)